MRILALATGLVAACSISVSSTAQQLPEPDPESRARIDILTPFIAEAVHRFPVPEKWIRAVMAAESGGRIELNGRPITSSAGAMGPMQVMPETYQDMRQRYGLGPDPYDPQSNILAGTAYLQELYLRFGFPGMFAAYNAGPDRYQQLLDTGRPLPEETVSYLAALGLSTTRNPKASLADNGSALFFPLAASVPPAPQQQSQRSGGELFVPLDPPKSESSTGNKKP